MNALLKSLLPIALIAVSCSDSTKPAGENSNTEDLTKQAMGGDAEAMDELKKQAAEASKQIKQEIEKGAA